MDLAATIEKTIIGGPSDPLWSVEVMLNQILSPLIIPDTRNARSSHQILRIFSCPLIFYLSVCLRSSKNVVASTVEGRANNPVAAEDAEICEASQY